MSENIIKVENVSKSFSGINVLNNINFELRKGEVHVLLGENGAGKSTLIKIITGMYAKDSGKVFFEDQEVNFTDIKQANNLGICTIHQELSIIPKINIARNVYLGRLPLKTGGFVDWKKIYEDTRKVLADMQLNFDPLTMASELSASQRQLLEIGRAMFFNSKVVIMDEPTSSLSAEEVKLLFQKIKVLKQKNIAVIYITHKLAEIFEIGDRVSVLRDGSLVATNNIKDIDMDSIIKMMVGRELAAGYYKAKVAIGEKVLDVKNLSRGKTVKDCSFFVRRGEILGLAGLVGSGRTEIVRALFGIDRPDTVEIELEGKSTKIKSPIDAINKGIVLVPEERKTQGIIPNQAIWKNVCFSAINCRRLFNNFYRYKFFLAKKKMFNSAVEYKKTLEIKAEDLERPVRFLSGGNQQKVVLAKALNTKPKVVILDEPTKGIDVGAKAEVFKIVGQLVSSGVAVILISSEHQEVLGVSDRVLVVNSGHIAGELDPKTATQEDILRLSVV